MPINTLLVEGDLDAQVLRPILADIDIEIGGPKNSLSPEARPITAQRCERRLSSRS